MSTRFKSNLAQRIVSLGLIVVMAFNPIMGQPEVASSLTQSVSQTYRDVRQDLRSRWYANGHARTFASLMMMYGIAGLVCHLGDGSLRFAAPGLHPRI